MTVPCESYSMMIGLLYPLITGIWPSLRVKTICTEHPIDSYQSSLTLEMVESRNLQARESRLKMEEFSALLEKHHMPLRLKRDAKVSTSLSHFVVLLCVCFFLCRSTPSFYCCLQPVLRLDQIIFSAVTLTLQAVKQLISYDAADSSCMCSFLSRSSDPSLSVCAHE